MNELCGQNTPVYSTFGDDPDLGELVEMFVEEMPDRVENLISQFDARNWGDLGRAAHQMKGAAGSYGFDVLTPCAARLEALVRGNEPEDQIKQGLDALTELCNRVRPGVGE